MTSNNSNLRSAEAQSIPFLRLGVDKAELKDIKVALMRRNVRDPVTTGPVLRSLGDPASLVIHYRPDEGVRPIFDREDVVVNKESQEERMILTSAHQGNDKISYPPITSRSSSESSGSSVDIPKKEEKKRLSPQPHCSRDRPKDDYRSKDYYASRSRRSSSACRKTVYKSSSPPRSSYPSARRSKTPHRSPEASKRRERSPPGGYGRSKTPPRYYSKYRHSRSPPGHRGSATERRRSRSPPPKVSGKARSPPKYRGPPERRRSRSPPPRRSSRGRSRSYSPHHRSRYSRSPHRREERRYESSRRRSRSPRRRYTPERREPKIYDPTRMPNPYFEGAEFWIPNPMLQPRFIPRQMIPPGAFPYPFRPGMPPMIPPRMPFRPRIVYNRPPRPRITPSTSTAASETTVVTTTTTGPSKESEENESKVTITECTSEGEHSAEKKD